jgi:hypothetical protein
MDKATTSLSILEEGYNQAQYPVEPHDNDVLCGRGGDINIHPGNIKFRKLVSTNKLVYLTCRFKREKRLIAERIVNDIKSQTPPGRFITKDKINGYWFEISDEKARDKTSQALREGAPKIREQIHSEMERKVTPKPNNMDWLSRDQSSYVDVYDARDSPYNYDSNSPSRRNDARYYNQHNILNTFRDRFGCPVNLNDVRDDDYSRDVDYDDPHEYETYEDYYNYPPTKLKTISHQQGGWKQRHYDLPQSYVEPRNQSIRDVDHYSGYHYNMAIHSDSKDPDGIKTSVCKVPQAKTPGMWQSLKSMLSWGSDGDLQEKPNIAATTEEPSCENVESSQQRGKQFIARPSEEVHSEKHWTSSFNPCYAFNPFQACESNLMDISNWNICGEHPESNITSIQSIEIDEPVPSGEMRGSSLVHVFDECPQTSETEKYDESALHDSSLNLVDLPSVEMNFSYDKDQALNIMFSKSEMSL